MDFPIHMTLPVDAEGFLRRRCPQCNGEFKWMGDRGVGEFAPGDTCYCPYCAEPATANEWHTQAQIEYAQQLMLSGGLADELKVQFATDALHGEPSEPTPPPTPLAEPADMRIVEPPCHPDEPFKVEEEWANAVHCVVCGSEV